MPEPDNTLLARIDERTEQQAKDISRVEDLVKDIDKKLDAKYVTLDKFEPIQRLVYGMVGLVLMAVVGSLLALVVKK